ncbi:MAG: hypothetical protein KatS3mg113_0402 [Planctomycetaceae bacterium]|nr:MAG: hypothetical protein KatS3mg113_0402 [Planctomycetaceae bacterium]
MWEQHSAQIQTLYGNHTRVEYNTVFEVESRSEGRFFYQAPDKGRFDVQGMKIRPGEKSARLGKEGTPYRLQSGKDGRWICTGQEVLQIDETTREYEVYPLPPEYRGANIIRSPLPFLFGIKAEEAKRRFQLALLSEKEEYYVLEALPRTNQENFKKAYIQLEKRRLIPTGVILFDTSGSTETRYTFRDININHSGFSGWIKSTFGGDPFRPNLRGYRLVQPPVVQQAGEERSEPSIQAPMPPMGSPRASNDRVPAPLPPRR